MRDLWEDKPELFAALYNAHYGQVDNTATLAAAFAAFDAHKMTHDKLRS
jgi:hypothetical protein